MFYHLASLKTFWGILLIAVAAAYSTGLFAGSGPAGSDQRLLVIYDPLDFDPILREDSEDIMTGRAVHRRVITINDSKHIDVGYNVYAKGVGGHVPYAYTKDEICYFPSGEFYVVSDGEEVTTRPGYFMWRPAYAATQTAIITEDAVSICAFAPARDVGWAHRVPQSDVGKWSGDPADKPRVVFYDFRDFKPLQRPGSHVYQSGKIVHRRVISKSNDGAVYMDASHDTLKAGAEVGPLAYTVDRACWLESGNIEISSNGTSYSMSANQFMLQPAYTKTDHIKVVRDSTMICFFAPAIDNGWGHVISD